jgi:hypothetical protein
MAKKLTMTDIKNENKKYTEKKKVVLSDEYYVHIYPNFSPESISELINEIISDSQRAKEVGINFDKISTSDWSIFNVIYKFTDLGIPTDIKRKVQAFTEIMNSEYLVKIIEAFPVESINKVKISLDNYVNSLKLLQNENKFNFESELSEQES